MEKIDFETLQANAAKLIGKQWMLVTAGKLGQCGTDFNTMTASWGGLGFLWNRPVAYVFVRPNRHTDKFMKAEERFTLSFMPEDKRKELMFCGRNSGRAVDKVAETGFTPFATEEGSVAFEGAELVLCCRKMYMQSMEAASFMDYSEVSPQWYAEDNPLHELYIAEIEACWVK